MALTVVGLLAAGCVTTRIVPLPDSAIQLDAAGERATVSREGIRLTVHPSAWRGAPVALPGYVTPFHLEVTSEASLPLDYSYPDLRLFDQARFQYTALPPVEVERILRWSEAPGLRIAAADIAVTAPLHRRPVGWVPWWDPWWGAYGALPYRGAFGLDEILARALPMGPLQPGARTAGFVYFPRLRPDARRLAFEFHHRVGDRPEVLTLPFAIRRGERRGASPTD